MWPNLEDYSKNHSFDLSGQELEQYKFLPPESFLNCNPVIVCQLWNENTKDRIYQVLEKGADANGITEKGCSFFSPLVWNALLNVGNWDSERTIALLLLSFPNDVNFVSLCGINLLHFYLLQSVLFPQYFYKLEWWVRFPMVDVNVPVLLYSGKKNKTLTILHPLEWLDRLITEHKTPLHLKRKIQNLLLARGASSMYGNTDYLPLDPMDWKNRHLNERLYHQWDVKQRTQLRYKIRYRFNLDFKMYEQIQRLLYQECGISPTVTINMTPLESVPSRHCLEFVSTASGRVFGFHPSYLESILKTHIFPFTGEPVPRNQIRQYLVQCQKQWFPREEFVLEDVVLNYPATLNHETVLRHPRKDIGIQRLYEWVSCFFPYSRIMNLFKRPDNLFRFLFKQMNRGDFIFEAFQKETPENNWLEAFFWASCDSLKETFFFSNRLEELIGLIEIHDLLSKKQPFHQKYPYARYFIESSESDLPILKLYQDEYEVSFLQLYYRLKNLSIELQSP